MPDSSSPDRPDGTGSAKGQPTPPESWSPGVTKGEGGAGSPEKVPRSEGKPEAAPRPRTSSSSPAPASPKPPPQGTKPTLAARPSIPLKPRTSTSSSSSRSIDESCDSPGGSVSPKGPGLPPTLKRGPSEREGTASPLLAGTGSRNSTQEVRLPSVTDTAQRQSPNRLNSEENGSKAKDKPPNSDKDKDKGGKSGDSGEEADKDFIFI